MFDMNDAENPEFLLLKNCNYVVIDTFISENIDYKDKFSIYSNNIRSLPNKWNDFIQIVEDFKNKKFKFSVYCFQEIWCIPPAFKPVLPGYKSMVYKTRDSTGSNMNAGGGVGILVDDRYEFQIIDKLSVFIPHVFESITIKIKVSKSKFIILCNVYRPNSGPLANINTFNNHLEDLLKNINNDPSLNNFHDLILTGDFNIDLLKSNAHIDTNRYLDILLENDLYPTISKPTRISQNSASIIDHINVKNISEFSRSGVLLDSLSDHCPVYYLSSIDQPKPKNSAIKTKTRIINENTTKTFIDILNSKDWEKVTNENVPSFAFSILLENIKTSFDEAFPLMYKCKTIKNTPVHPWMTLGLLKSRKTKQNLYSRKTVNPTEHNIKRFNSYVKTFKLLCRLAKTKYYVNKINEFKNNSQKTWNTVREVLGTFKDKSQIPEFFIENGEIIKGNLNIAEGFNKFFAEIGSNLSSKIKDNDKAFQAYLNDPIEESFVFQKVTPESIFEVGKSLKPKSSSGIDNISSKLLKDILSLTNIPLYHVFNLSFQTGYIPVELKTARVVPIFKSDQNTDFNNYRPISLLPSISKLLEKLVAKQMTSFLNKHSILYELQFGFRKGHDTTQPVLHFLNKISEALSRDEPEFTIGIFLDLKKAFDTADHRILIEKLKNYGFRGVSGLWFKNYLTNRQQIVTINGVDSEPRKLDIGVPQGSVLGPLLFLLLINDLPNAVDFFTLLYADDTTFQLSSKHLSDLSIKVNKELEKAANWFSSNKLTLNISKTKFMLFKPKRINVDVSELKININGISLERIGSNLPTKSFKFVGLNIDENLTWEFHISKTKSKLAYANQLISKAKNFLPLETRVLLYNCLFKPHLEYGVVAWGGAGQNRLRGIINAQKKCLRNILCKKSMSHTEPLFKKLKILKFNDLFEYNCVVCMHNIVYNNANFNLKKIFKPALSSRTKNFMVGLYHNLSLKQLPAYYLPIKWNLCSIELKNIDSKTTFKHLMLSILTDKYVSNQKKCKNLMCPDCFI